MPGTHDTLADALAAETDVQLAVLFGSEARGDARADSDLDVAVSGPDASEFPCLALKLTRAMGREVDVVSMSAAPPLLRFEIARDGLVLVERQPYLWSDVKARAMVDWWDWAPTARLFHAAAAARLHEQVTRGRREVAGARIARAAAWLDDASRILDQPIDDFVAATRDRDLALFYLFLAIQETIDLSAHWVADAGWGAPDDAGSTFDVLAARHCIDHDLANQLRLATGLCNRIAHGYAMLDYTRVHAESRAGIPALRRFLAAVAVEAGL